MFLCFSEMLEVGFFLLFFFFFNFSSLGDFTAAILFLLFLGKVSRNGYVCALSVLIVSLYTLGDKLYSCSCSLLLSYS